MNQTSVPRGWISLGLLAVAMALVAIDAGSATTATVAANPIRLQAEVLQETRVAGAQAATLGPAERLAAGDEVIYRVNYTHTGSEPAQVVITNPLPTGLVYLPGSGTALGVRLEVSVDGGRQFGAFKRLRATAPGGTKRAAVATDITHVRWVLEQPVAPGAVGAVSLRARIR